MITKLEAMLLEAKEKIQATATEHDLYELKAYYTGKKSPLGEIMKQMGSLTPEERKTLGAKANETKQAIEKLIFDQRKALEDQKINAKLESEKIDVIENMNRISLTTNVVENVDSLVPIYLKDR